MKNVARNLAVSLFLLGILLVGGCGGRREGPDFRFVSARPDADFFAVA